MRCYPWVILASVLLSCTACLTTGQEPRALGQHRAMWTVLVFMNGDNELDPFALSDFEEMAKVGSSDDLHIVVQLDRMGGIKRGAPSWSQTLRFHITRGMKPVPTEALMDLGEVNMGSPDALADFVSWGMAKFPADRYALIIWDHGQGYRNLVIEPQVVSRPHPPANAGERPEASALAVIHRSGTEAPHRSVSHDYTNDDELFNAEVSLALRTALGDRKLDVLGFDACLMSMVETAYAFRSFAQVMVGSEDLEPGEGWQYDDWLGQLAASLSMKTRAAEGEELDARGLGRLLVESYSRRYGKPSERLLPDPTTTLSAVALDNMEAVARAVSALAVAMKDALPGEAGAIQAARGRCANFAPNTFGYDRDEFFHVDFIHFCEQLLETQVSAPTQAAAREALQLARTAVVASYAGSARHSRSAFGTSGLAIYFPSGKKEYQRDLYVRGGYEKENDYQPVVFVKEHQWTDFLHAYFQVSP